MTRSIVAYTIKSWLFIKVSFCARVQCHLSAITKTLHTINPYNVTLYRIDKPSYFVRGRNPQARYLARTKSRPTFITRFWPTISIADICLVEYSWPVWGVSNNFIDASNKFWQLFNARSRKQKRKFRHKSTPLRKERKAFMSGEKCPACVEPTLRFFRS